MATLPFFSPPPVKVRKSSISLENGSRVAVIGGGPAGSFFSYFLLDLAQRIGLGLRVDIFEPRDFSLPAPSGCNMCAGVISETLIQNLAAEGINLPASVVQRGIHTYILHTDLGSLKIESPLAEKRIAATYRGAGPHGIREIKFKGLDSHLLSLAAEKGAKVIRSRVTGVNRSDDTLQISTAESENGGYHLLAVAAGVNTAVLKRLDPVAAGYCPPKTVKTAIREYFLGVETVQKYFGDSLHVFLLDIPGLDFAVIVPKDMYVSICLMGKDIQEPLLRAFLTAPEVKACFPDGWRWDQPDCQCTPRINVGGTCQPYSDRVVVIGDSGVTRLYKDGIGAAYRAAKSAAACAVLEGISAEDFRSFYAPFCRRADVDNRFGRFIFFVTHILQHTRLSRRAVLRMAAAEQLSPQAHQHSMSAVLWDTFTGNTPYRDVFGRMLHPAFASRFAWRLVNASFGR